MDAARRWNTRDPCRIPRLFSVSRVLGCFLPALFSSEEGLLERAQPWQALKSNAVMPYINTNLTKGLRDLGLPEQSGGTADTCRVYISKYGQHKVSRRG